jgi:hypothetical protein
MQCSRYQANLRQNSQKYIISPSINMQGYIYEVDAGTNSKIQFPKEDKQDLGLVQRYIVFQIFLPYGTPFSLEMALSDTTKVPIVSLLTPIDKTKNPFHFEC